MTERRAVRRRLWLQRADALLHEYDIARVDGLGGAERDRLMTHLSTHPDTESPMTQPTAAKWPFPTRTVLPPTAPPLEPPTPTIIDCRVGGGGATGAPLGGPKVAP